MVAYAQYSRDARIKSYVKTLRQRGANVDLFILREPGKESTETSGGLTIHHVSRHYRGSSALRYVLSYLVFFLTTLVRVSWLSIFRGYKTVHVHNMPNLLVFTAIVPKLLGARVLLDVHDLMMANYMAKFGVSEDHFMVRCLRLEQKLSALMANRVI
jgi:hypothetical protein